MPSPTRRGRHDLSTLKIAGLVAGLAIGGSLLGAVVYDVLDVNPFVVNTPVIFAAYKGTGLLLRPIRRISHVIAPRWRSRSEPAVRHSDSAIPGGWRVRVAAAFMPEHARQRWLEDIETTLYDFGPDQHRRLLRDFLAHAPAVTAAAWTAKLDGTRPSGRRP